MSSSPGVALNEYKIEKSFSMFGPRFYVLRRHEMTQTGQCVWFEVGKPPISFECYGKAEDHIRKLLEENK